MTSQEYRTKCIKEFQETEAKYFYLVGDDETSQDCLTMTENRTITEALLFAKEHFENLIKEIENDQLECYRDSEELNKTEEIKPPFYGDIIELMNKEKITYKEACERITKKNEKDLHNN